MYNLNEVLKIGVEKKASDIHFSVGRPVAYRVNGVLRPEGGEILCPSDMERMMIPILKERHKSELEEFGQTDFSYASEEGSRFRVNVFRQKGTIACVMRIFPDRIPEPESLGIPREVVELTKKKRGLVLVTGPTGSGKSTTLASLINVINQNYEEHVITMEDPIEYIYDHARSTVNQREVGSDTESYASALRAALRQDPDVILVGEMRDLETISTAITAAETGHLVFSTLHTIGADKTIDRVIDVFPPGQQQQIRVQMAAVLECVISQQLLPRVGGGRIAALETMFANPAIRSLIREGKTFQIPSTMQTNRRVGMITMDDALYELYMNNQITMEDGMTFAQDPGNMARRLNYYNK